MLAWVWCVFAFGAIALALVIFPNWRNAIGEIVVDQTEKARQTQEEWIDAADHRRQLTADAASKRLNRIKAIASSNWKWAVLVAVLLALPAAVVGWVAWSGGQSLDGFEERVQSSNHQVAQLLQGEHLVPPPPLPPDVFATAEVEQVRPMLSTADRRWDQMDEAFVQRLLLVFKIMREEHGYDMALLEGYRSPQRQEMLAAKGGHVTQAKAWQSYHQYGLAADCAFVREGKLVISEKDPWAMRGYELYGQVAEQVGLTWGGRWAMMDFGHVEWRKPGLKKVAPQSE